MRSTAQGMTLVEVLVGMTVFAVGVLPLLLVLGRAGNAAKVRDLCVAQALLEGELSIMESSGALPEAERSLNVSGRKYIVRCVVDTVEGCAQWCVRVERSGRSIGELRGLQALPPDRGADRW
ncbi:MAG: prepilin-type N-terminal cleavage/methylation domain-containing protein [Chitinivibrionales bacterium]|nr:prepilin-type N-terminal cleavage/methylation domain-containing protein [Chitinivibrionales bacterium]